MKKTSGKEKDLRRNAAEIVIIFLVVLGASLGCLAYYLKYENTLYQGKISSASEAYSVLRNEANDFKIQGGEDYTKQFAEIDQLQKEGKVDSQIERLAQLRVNLGIAKKKLEKKKAADAKAEAEAKKKAEDEAKAAAEKLAAQQKQAKVVQPSYASYPVSQGSCSKNEYYVVVNVNTNTEQVYMGDPDCRTGNVLESRNVATGMHQNLWNPAGWSYWGGTPTGKWKIISKESTSGQFGPWFLRLHYLAGGYVDQYALHGTDTPSSIGNWASHGCIRHYNEDIIHLASILPIGTVVWTVG